MKIVLGDMFEGDVEALAHGVNCRGRMGAGVAKVFRDKYPKMYEEYRQLCHNRQLQPGNVFAYYDYNRGYIYNLASQDDTGPDARVEWIVQSVSKMLEHASENGISSIGIPKIGSNIGGLNWLDVENALLEVSSEYPDVELVVYVVE